MYFSLYLLEKCDKNIQYTAAICYTDYTNVGSNIAALYYIFLSHFFNKYEGKYIKYLQVKYLSIILNIC